MAELLSGVEAPKDGTIKNNELKQILKRRGCEDNVIKLILDLADGRDIMDCSGYSGSTTIIIPSSPTDQGYSIKINDNEGSLQEEVILMDFFAKYGLTQKVLNYIQNKKDYIITRKMPGEMALTQLCELKSLAEFMGKSLRSFHEINWDKTTMTAQEKQIILARSNQIFERCQKNTNGLSPMSDYQNDNNFKDMKNYIAQNKNQYVADDVIFHGDFNPRNVFSNGQHFTGLIDFTDSGYGDRHYDIYWTMWSVSLYLGLQGNPIMVNKCEETFKNAYGRDKIDENRMTLCKKMNCMYWQDSNDIKGLM